MSISYPLVCHPEIPTRAVQAINVSVVRQSGNRLRLVYTLQANLRALVLKGRGEGAPVRKDGLWEADNSCFEAFVMPGEGPGYAEFNVSPDQDWAAYGFLDRREGRQDLAVPAPRIDFWHSRGELTADLDLTGIGMLAGAQVLRLGLTAILLDRRGKRSYWALAHPDGPPDFHDPACFTARLSAPVAP